MPRHLTFAFAIRDPKSHNRGAPKEETAARRSNLREELQAGNCASPQPPSGLRNTSSKLPTVETVGLARFSLREMGRAPRCTLGLAQGRYGPARAACPRVPRCSGGRSENMQFAFVSGSCSH